MLGREERGDSSGCSLRQGAGASCCVPHRVAARASVDPLKLAASCLPVLAGDPELSDETGRALVKGRRGPIWIQVQR